MILLAADPCPSSGAILLEGGRVVWKGTVRDPGLIRSTVAHALELAEMRLGRRDLLEVAMETWQGLKLDPHHEAAGAWKHELALQGYPVERVERYLAVSWQKTVHGTIPKKGPRFDAWLRLRGLERRPSKSRGDDIKLATKKKVEHLYRVQLRDTEQGDALGIAHAHRIAKGELERRSA